MKNKLVIKNLYVRVDGKEILKGVNLEIKAGEVHALMGPNGSGKSTLANALMGNPKYRITKGSIRLDGKNINELSPDKRAKLGLFLSFQYPNEIPGLTVSNFLRTALNSIQGKKISVINFHKLLREKMSCLKMDRKFGVRYLNDGFSGGEKKRAEILQMLVLDPKYCILDETDSGLDIDALKTVASGINTLKDSGKPKGILLITHYYRILNYITPDQVHIMVNGKIVKSGDKELAQQIEKEGYESLGIRNDKNE